EPGPHLLAGVDAYVGPAGVGLRIQRVRGRRVAQGGVERGGQRLRVEDLREDLVADQVHGVHARGPRVVERGAGVAGVVAPLAVVPAPRAGEPPGRPLRPFRFGAQVANARSRTGWADLARKVEDLGFSTLFVPDHFDDQLAPVPALMAAADATTALRVGTM